MVESRYYKDKQLRKDAEKVLAFVDEELGLKTEKDLDLLLELLYNRKRNTQRANPPENSKEVDLEYVG